MLEEAFAGRDAEAWEAELRRRGVPCSRVRTVADLARDPHLDELGLIESMSRPGRADLRVVGMPITLDGHRSPVRSSPPTPGAHTDGVPAELGYGPHEIARLRRAGAAGRAE